jgi:hypothetical protein
MEAFIEWLNANRLNEQFLFTMDNLNLHKHPMILDMIENAGYRIVFCAPYWLYNDTIESLFNTIHIKLQMSERDVSTVDDLILELDDILAGMVDASFYLYFQHAGFP